MLRFLTAGESHGPAEVAILEGIPAGLSITVDDIQKELDKRRAGAGRGGRGQIEKDQVKILSGVRLGKTLGSPIALMVENQDFANWKEKMQIDPKSSGAKLFHLTGGIRSHLDTNTEKITNPRPGHADLAGTLKYHFDDIRNVLERASARETIMRVAVGAVCKRLLAEFDIELVSHTIQIGDVKLEGVGPSEGPTLFNKIKRVFETDPEIRCIDLATSQKMKQAILEATKKKETLGGVIEIIAFNVPPGLGSYVHYDRKLDGRLAQVLMSIPSVKAVEIGEGVKISNLFGSEVHDEIFYSKRFFRKTNRAGGIEGGVSNGQDIIARVYHKPLSTLGRPLNSVDIKTKKPSKALVERSDICVVPRASVISEAMLAFVLAQAFLKKFGSDSLAEVKRNFENYTNDLSNLGD